MSPIQGIVLEKPRKDGKGQECGFLGAEVFRWGRRILRRGPSIPDAREVGGQLRAPESSSFQTSRQQMPAAAAVGLQFPNVHQRA